MCSRFSTYKGFFLVLLIVLIGCQPVTLEDQLPDSNQIVINGLITNGAGPYEVSVTRTLPFLSSDSQRTVSNASVFVVDNFDDTIEFSEIEPGLYRTTSATFSGNVGATYQLNVVLEDSTEYQSEEAFLRPMVGLDELRCLNCLASDFSTGNKRVTGIINILENAENLFRWKLYLNRQLLSTPQDLIAIEVENTESTQINRVISHRTFNRNDTLRVEQLSLTRENLDFLNLVIDQISGQTLSSPVLPANSVGNIRSLTNPGEVVLGFFAASSIDTKEIIIK